MSNNIAILIAATGGAAKRGVTPADVPERLQTYEFAEVWREYVERRQRQYGEIMSAATIRAAWLFIADETDPVEVVIRACNSRNRQRCFKQFVPLTETELWKQMPPNVRYAQRSHRWERSSSRNEVADTVFAPRSVVVEYLQKEVKQ